MTTKICKRCGKEFTTNHNARKFCNNCRLQVGGRAKPSKSIEEINEAARALNLSYGQYMAKYGYAKEGVPGGI